MGTGVYFKENIGKVKRVYDLKYVCDNNLMLLGKDVAEDVYCISPL